MRAPLPVLALVLLVSACGGGGGRGDGGPTDPVDPPTCRSWGTFASVGTVLPDVTTGALTEISGLAVGRLNPDVLWAHDDSGGGPLLHALAEDGRVLQVYELDVSPYDWEDLAVGPGPEPDRAYVYVADVGDNGRRRDHVTLLRLEEPLVPTTPGPPRALPHVAFSLRYPDGAHDAEALVIDGSTGALYVITKDPAGGDAYRTPLPLDPAWTTASPGTFVRVTDDRPLPADVTAADATALGDRVVLRTYTAGYELLRPRDGTFEELFRAEPCPFAVPFLGQFESLAIDPDGTVLYTTTEQVLGAGVPLLRAVAAR